jgi:hypothetical protein
MGSASGREPGLTTVWILISGLGLVLLLPIVWRVVRRRFDPFEPIVLFVAAYGVVFVVRPAAMLVDGELSFAGVDLSPTLALMALLALVGAAGFVSGYELGLASRLADRLPAPREIPTTTAVAGAAVLGAVAGLAVVTLGARFGYDFLISDRSSQVAEASSTSPYVWYASRLVVPAALLLTALVVRERSKWLALGSGLACAASLLLTVPVGSRIFLLPFLGGVVVFLYAYHRKRPSLPVIAALVLAAFVVAYAAVIVREPERRAHAGSEFARLVKHPAEVFNLVLHRGDAEMAPVLAGALTAVPDRLGYRYGGATIGEVFVRPIPRKLWQGKPTPPGEQVVETVWPDLAGSLHPAFSPLLPLYWDFGIVGVFAGMAVFGIACRTLYEWFLRHKRAFAAQLIFSVAIWYVAVGVRNEPVDTIVLASFVVLPLILVERLGARRPVLRPLLARARR